MSTYTGKVVVITGASAGIGRGLALAIAAERPRLVLAARDRERLEGTAVSCRALGAEAIVVPTDVAEEMACHALIARAVEAFDAVDALVWNAGISMWAPFAELTDFAVFERMMRVNYLGGVYLCAAALPHLRNVGGQIVGIASVAGLTGVPTRTGYAASKHAQVGFLDSLRVELMGSGIDVTVVAPDFVRSESRERAIGVDGRPLGLSPVQEARVMSTEECAQRILAAMRGRRRLVILSARGRLGRWLRLIAPGLIDRIARRAIARGR
ncbi:MAG: SDR family oxidoreductase [Acidobacteriota bacterium]